MKFGQLIGYKMRYMFLGKSCPKCGGETIPRTFLKKSLYLDQESEVFIVCLSQGLPNYIETKVRTTCFYFI